MSMRQYVNSNKEAQLLQRVPVPAVVKSTGAMMENEEIIKQDFENWLDDLDPVPYSYDGGWEEFWADVDDFLGEYVSPEDYASQAQEGGMF